jgi:hypothetical protein
VAAGGYLPLVLSSCPVLNTAAPVVQTAGGCWSVLCPWGIVAHWAHVYYNNYTLLGFVLNRKSISSIVSMYIAIV